MYNRNIFLMVFVLVWGVFGDTSSVKNMRPENNAIVSDCPTFSWSPSFGALSYDIVVKLKNGGIVINENVEGSKYVIAPTDKEKFLEIGQYTWNVTANFGDGSHFYKSDTLNFEIKTHSCIPSRVSNKIDNSLNAFSQNSVTFENAVVSNKWKKLDKVELTANNNPVTFYPYKNENIFSVQEHEHYSNNKTDVKYANASVVILKPDIGDNIVAFRYVFYSTGNSTILVELVDNGKNTTLGCIGPNVLDWVQCEQSTHGRTGNDTVYYSPNLALEGGKVPKWDLFQKEFEPRKSSNQVTLRLSYIRANKTKSDSIPDGNANYLFISSEFVFGQCSSVPSEYFDSTNTSGDIGEHCIMCNDAGYRYPVGYSDQCLACETINNMGNCESISYCTPCRSKSQCQATPTSTCRAEAGCPDSPDEDNCGSDCAWCKVEQKCIFSADKYSNCTACSAFNKMADCDSHGGACSWCATLKVCLDKGDVCPGCSVIFDSEKCTLAKTDGSCQYCNKKSACLSSDTECNSICSTKTTVKTCNAEIDCQWCDSKNACTEKRIECKDCKEASRSECGVGDFSGCSLCESGMCVIKDKLEDCPVCKERTKDNCNIEQGVSLDCKFCESTLECMRLQDDCQNCSSINSTSCGSFNGCLFCKSDQVCMPTSGQVKECECIGMDGVTCARHTKGCCYTTACYEINDERCNPGLSTEMIIIIAAVGGVVLLAIIIIIPVLICCCKPKANEGIEMSAPGTIVVLPEGQPSMVVAQESIQSINGGDPATAVSVDETTTTNAGMQPSQSLQDMQNMQNMQMMQQQMLSTMMAQQQMMNSMGMMNPMMMNSMGMMNMTGGMAGMSGMNSMGGGMDMNSMNMTGGMNSMGMTGGMNSMGMTGGMNSMGMTGGMNSMGNGMPSGPAPGQP